MRGLADPPLDETGSRQAERLGSRGLAAVSASPLVRARQTALPVAERTGMEVAADQCLLDRDYGPWASIIGYTSLRRKVQQPAARHRPFRTVNLCDISFDRPDDAASQLDRLQAAFTVGE